MSFENGGALSPALSTISTANRMHVSSDATTKKRVHVLQTVIRMEMIGEDDMWRWMYP